MIIIPSLITDFWSLCHFVVHSQDIFPDHVVVPTGKTLSLTCNSITAPVWGKYDGRIKTHSSLQLNSLFVYSMREEDHGLYLCSGTGYDGQGFNASAVVLVGSRCILDIVSALMPSLSG